MSSLKFKFIGNACGIFTGKNGTKLLCDPWVVNGVFDGSWCHYPPLQTTVDDIMDVDAIYVSHLHPDHFDERYFVFAKDTPIVVLDHGGNFLHKRLESLNYKNLIKIKNRQRVEFRELSLTCFAPFSRHTFHDTEVENLIDSALLVECDGISAFNANDNTPYIDIKSATHLRSEYGQFDLAMLNYNAAGPYPSCFDNLSEKEKFSEHSLIIRRNLDHLVSLLGILQPKVFLPFAGAYVLGGKEHHKNAYLATITWDECLEYLSRQPNICRTVTLRENDTYDVGEGKSDRSYVPIDVNEMKMYIGRILSRIRYPYEDDQMPRASQLVEELESASSNMRTRMRKLGITSSYQVEIVIYDKKYQIYPTFCEPPYESNDKRLECKLDERLLRRIFYKKSHWNNAQIGGHINFFRHPNLYEPDLHVALQFMQL